MSPAETQLEREIGAALAGVTSTTVERTLIEVFILEPGATSQRAPDWNAARAAWPHVERHRIKIDHRDGFRDGGTRTVSPRGDA